MLLRLLLALLLVVSATTDALAKEYRAARFDVRLEVLDGGSLRVTETIVFDFTEGTFRHVYRRIPTRRTDGIEFVAASMDGATLPPGDGPGQVEVRRSRNTLRVDWHFAPVAPGTHTFELTYIARGVVYPENGQELLAWRALPREHDYEIRASSVQVRLPADPTGQVRLEKRRVRGQTGMAFHDDMIVFQAALIRRNGWIEPHIRFPRGAVLDAPPQWWQRQAQHREMLPRWGAIAGGIALLGFMLLVLLRQGYDSPPRSTGAAWSSLIPPDALPPAVAGALVANGSPRLEHAMAALLHLAERGAVTVREEPRGRWSQRSFVIERGASTGELARHEQALLDLVFHEPHRERVTLSRARTHLMRHWKRFKQPLLDDMRDLGLLDEHRAAHRHRYMAIGTFLLLAGAAAVVVGLLLLERYGGGALLIAAALGLLGLASFIFASAGTPLSNDGVRRAEHWRGYQQHLRRPQDIEPRWGGTASAEWRVLPFAVALGLAAAWSRFMKKRAVQTPAWFQAASAIDSGRAFSTFIYTGGAGAHGGGAGGGGGAAGGGASGAG